MAIWRIRKYFRVWIRAQEDFFGEKTRGRKSCASVPLIWKNGEKSLRCLNCGQSSLSTILYDSLSKLAAEYVVVSQISPLLIIATSHLK
jgi:hypothetical protein